MFDVEADQKWASLVMAEVLLSFPVLESKPIGGIYWQEGHTILLGKIEEQCSPFRDSRLEGRSFRLAPSTRTNHLNYEVRYTLCSVGEVTASS